MLIFVLGGVKSGKSMFSQSAAKILHNNSKGKLYYLATMQPNDKEDMLRIKRHLNDRKGWGFITLEESVNIDNISDIITADDTILLDSVTSYVQNNMFYEGAIQSLSFDKLAGVMVSVLRKAANAVVVSDYIFSEASNIGEGTVLYCQNLGLVHRIIASEADIVAECACSNVKLWKNEKNFSIREIISFYNSLTSHLYYNDI